MRMLFLAISLVSFLSGLAWAENVPLKNHPRHSVGSDEGVKIYGLLNTETIQPNSVIGAKIEIQNMSDKIIAIATVVGGLSFDQETNSLVYTLGMEFPQNERLPVMGFIKSGETVQIPVNSLKIPRMNPNMGKTPFVRPPRNIQFKVVLLKDIQGLIELIKKQQSLPDDKKTSLTLDDAQFGFWLENVTTISLNPVPIQFSNGKESDPQPNGAEISGAQYNQQ